MKFQVTLKDPDTLSDAVTEAVMESLKDSGLNDREKEAVIEVRHEETYEEASKWFQWGEYLTVEIDTEANTCTVIKP